MIKKAEVLLFVAAFICWVSSIGLSGCALGIGRSIHDVNQLDYTDVSASKKARAVEALGDDTIILSLTSDTRYADQAYRKLQEQCPKGEIVNIVTQHSTELGFLAYKEKVSLKGTCLE